MKTNCKLTNIKYNFSKNLFKALIAPIVAVVLAIVFMFTIGFNRDMDYRGGLYVSVVAVSQTTGEKLDLTKTEEYNAFKKDVDDVLIANNVKGNVYTVEVNDMQESVLVVKFAFDGNETEKQALIESIKSDLVTKFYSTTPSEDLENNHLVIVAPFGNAIRLKSVEYLTTVLATLVCSIVVCVYIAIRMGLNAGILSLCAGLFNNVFAMSLICIARVQLTYTTIIVFPFVTIVSILSAYLYLKKTKDLLYTTNNYDRKSNFELADDAVKKTISKQLLLAGITGIGLLVLGLFNICNSVFFLSLSLFTSVACILYTNLLLLPGLFARTYVRKVKKNKPKTEKKQDDTLTEEQVMKETDLDNLVSN